MALSRRRGTLEPISTSGFNLRQSMGLPGRGMASRASLGPSTFDKAAKPQVRHDGTGTAQALPACI